MKKIVVLLLVLCMVGALSACGGEAPPVDIQNEATKAPLVEKQDTVEEQEKTDAVQQLDFPETVIVDDENVTVKITGIETDGMWGYTLKVFLENKTDLNLMYSMDRVSVSGCMCDPFWATVVNAGMKANEQIAFDYNVFEEYGIVDVTDITFDLHIYDDDNWENDSLLKETYTVYPLGKEAAKEYQRQEKPTDEVLFNTDTCAMIVTGYDPDDMWGYTVKAFLVNKTEEAVMFAIDDASVNGFMCDPYWAEEVAAGKVSYAEIAWSEEDFELNDIIEVETLTLPVRVSYSDNWEADSLLEETFELNP